MVLDRFSELFSQSTASSKAIKLQASPSINSLFDTSIRPKLQDHKNVRMRVHNFWAQFIHENKANFHSKLRYFANETNIYIYMYMYHFLSFIRYELQV